MTPLLPWRPAILSPTWSLRFIATKTLTVLLTPGASSSPFARSCTRSAETFLMTSICESVRWRMRRTVSRISSSFSFKFFSMRGVIIAIFSAVSFDPSLTTTFPCESVTSSTTVRFWRRLSIFSFASVRMMRISSSEFFWSRPISSSRICLARTSFCFSSSFRVKIFTSTTTPSMPGGHLSEASRTSPAFSPKIARRSFSSGVSCVSPFGVTLPTRMSPGLTVAPMRMMPLSSRSRRACSDTLGMSLVISSAPSFVSRASISNSSMWMEV